ncbi:potassium channel family protein [Protaetiibacter mangrovi]|uniref:Potassium channel family protein n=1 Tax=Protaetiibacter mangrovi TaxID=2970926 RepID=A0ABT1ZF23_9MICO|nr:potassium channel family protein [Protaetiibacter mangrovi]MCS0499279.1 potassium channel family protein [Protaetiibacter mangrovi]
MAAVVFLIAYSVEVIGDLDDAAAVIPEALMIVTWAVFLVDYSVNLVLAERRGRWFLTHLFDLAIVVLPILRPLRLLRLVTLLTILQRTAGTALRGRIIIYVVGASVLLVYVAALAVLDAERGQGGSIQNLQEGLWWAFVTITTVGYGDYYPITATGQIVAVGIMVGGITLIGVVTATFASWIVEKVDAHSVRQQAATRGQVEELREEIRALRELLAGSGAP